MFRNSSYPINNLIRDERKGQITRAYSNNAWPNFGLGQTRLEQLWEAPQLNQ